MSMIDRCKFLHNLPCEQVSDRIVELEAENAELRQERDLYRELFNLTTQPDRYVQVKAENAKLRGLARKNWFIALSERDALRIHGADPDDGAYITALDMEMNESRATMQELGIEVE